MITKTIHGTTQAGEVAHLYTLSQEPFEVTISTYGGTIISLITPDAHHHKKNIVLSYNTLSEYEQSNAFLGCLIGRVANRIRKGHFSIGEETYTVPLWLETSSAIHGGPKGFCYQNWEATTSEDTHNSTLSLTYLSKDGENGFPGNVKVQVDYSLTSKGELEISYSATTDQTTPLNLTNHAYFNLGNTRTVTDHVIHLPSKSYLPVDKEGIPLGTVEKVEHSHLDFTTPRRIEQTIYDNCYIIKERQDSSFIECAYVVEPSTKRSMRVYTTMEALQFFTNDNVEIAPGVETGGFCLETQRYIDALNVPHFPSILLEPGKTYKEKTVYQFSIADEL